MASSMETGWTERFWVKSSGDRNSFQLIIRQKTALAAMPGATNGSATGVRLLSQRAREAGATDAELMDVLKVCYSVGGMQALSDGAAALTERG
ncbi:MAG: carboxymuconolactone decarboxylase family protein [Chloroflexi bacterium]|nr:carboxymuconolactone decarboxylase family protein [Chloroflexota bacterium]